MIVQEHFTLSGVDFIRTFSDAGRYVVGGEPYGEYVEATDPAEFNRQYIEGDYIDEDESALSNEEIISILLGGIEE